MIDSATVERIKGAANIVEVVSEFVTLRRSGANYKGLCPFHDEKTPSFIVSPARGTCHCFGCGKGGNAVTFIMEHEQMTYPEALRWLAAKYHIDIQERELTSEERAAQSARESMFIVNEWAANYFQRTLHDNVDGQTIGLQYYRSRGIRDDIIARFRLGYDITDRRAFAKTAVAAGLNEDYILQTGICYRNDRGEMIDRYAGRVIFPWIGVSGKVTGFGGRLLDRRTKGVAQKYVNSPDSDIFHKERELYGIYQAKKAIAKEDRVYMVEGYTDVIAMHQSGIENVVANSGTALSTYQIQTLRRFTQNITLLYDGDAAGIHAAMRGTDMLLAAGMNLRVLLLPDGDDPDSYARKHTAADFRRYIEENQTDFIRFKTKLLLRDERDPLKRSEAINSIVKSISLVQDQILRDTYVHDCSASIGIAETTLVNTMNGFIRAARGATQPQTRAVSPTALTPRQPVADATEQMSTADKVERLIARLIVRHGGETLCADVEQEDGTHVSLTVAQYVRENLAEDGLSLANKLYSDMLDEAADHAAEEHFDAERYFVQHRNIDIGRIAAQLSADRYPSMSAQKDDEQCNEEQRRLREEEHIERLRRQTDHLLNDFRRAYLEQQLAETRKSLLATGDDEEQTTQLMQRYKDLLEMRSTLARVLGGNIIT